jgi:hypothetical protein
MISDKLITETAKEIAKILIDKNLERIMPEELKKIIEKVDKELSRYVDNQEKETTEEAKMGDSLGEESSKRLKNAMRDIPD